MVYSIGTDVKLNVENCHPTSPFDHKRFFIESMLLGGDEYSYIIEDLDGNILPVVVDEGELVEV